MEVRGRCCDPEVSALVRNPISSCAGGTKKCFIGTITTLNACGRGVKGAMGVGCTKVENCWSAMKNGVSSSCKATTGLVAAGLRKCGNGTMTALRAGGNGTMTALSAWSRGAKGLIAGGAKIAWNGAAEKVNNCFMKTVGKYMSTQLNTLIPMAVGAGVGAGALYYAQNGLPEFASVTTADFNLNHDIPYTSNTTLSDIVDAETLVTSVNCAVSAVAAGLMSLGAKNCIAATKIDPKKVEQFKAEKAEKQKINDIKAIIKKVVEKLCKDIESEYIEINGLNALNCIGVNQKTTIKNKKTAKINKTMGIIKVLLQLKEGDIGSFNRLLQNIAKRSQRSTFDNLSKWRAERALADNIKLLINKLSISPKHTLENFITMVEGIKLGNQACLDIYKDAVKEGSETYGKDLSNMRKLIAQFNQKNISRQSNAITKIQRVYFRYKIFKRIKARKKEHEAQVNKLKQDIGSQLQNIGAAIAVKSNTKGELPKGLGQLSSEYTQFSDYWNAVTGEVVGDAPVCDLINRLEIDLNQKLANAAIDRNKDELRNFTAMVRDKVANPTYLEAVMSELKKLSVKIQGVQVLPQIEPYFEEVHFELDGQ